SDVCSSDLRRVGDVERHDRRALALVAGPTVSVFERGDVEDLPDDTGITDVPRNGKARQLGHLGGVARVDHHHVARLHVATGARVLVVYVLAVVPVQGEHDLVLDVHLERGRLDAVPTQQLRRVDVRDIDGCNPAVTAHRVQAIASHLDDVGLFDQPTRVLTTVAAGAASTRRAAVEPGGRRAVAVATAGGRDADRARGAGTRGAAWVGRFEVLGRNGVGIGCAVPLTGATRELEQTSEGGAGQPRHGFDGTMRHRFSCQQA